MALRTPFVCYTLWIAYMGFLCWLWSTEWHAVCHDEWLKRTLQVIWYGINTDPIQVAVVMIIVSSWNRYQFIFLLINLSCDFRILINKSYLAFNPICMYCLVKVDGWTDIQKDLDKRPYSQWFTVIFIFLGHFIFTNLFIGIIIMVSIKLHVIILNKSIWSSNTCNLPTWETCKAKQNWVCFCRHFRSFWRRTWDSNVALFKKSSLWEQRNLTKICKTHFWNDHSTPRLQKKISHFRYCFYQD